MGGAYLRSRIKQAGKWDQETIVSFFLCQYCSGEYLPVAVGDIAEALDLSQSLVSHHLRLLRGARLVRGERQAKHIFYSIADQHVSQVLQDMAVHISEDKADD